MADGTRLKELQEAQKKLDQVLQTETMKRNVNEEKIKEQITGLEQKVDHNYEELSITLKEIKQHLLNLNQNKDEGSVSILGPIPFSAEGNSGKSTAFSSKLKGDYSYSSGATSMNYVHKIDFPRFNGSNPRGWIIKCSTYFKLTASMPDENMIQLVVHNFEGKALQWIQNFGFENIFSVTWEQFLEVVATKFDDLNEREIVMEFKNLKQVGSYTDYVEKFEELRACLLLSNNMKYCEEYFIASFISGLTEEMQGFMLLFKPKSPEEAIERGKP